MSIPLIPTGTATGTGWQYRIERSSLFSPWTPWADDLAFSADPDGNDWRIDVPYWLHARNATLPAYTPGSLEKDLARQFYVRENNRITDTLTENETGLSVSGSNYSFKPVGSTVGPGWQYKLERDGIATPLVNWSDTLTFSQDPEGGSLHIEEIYWLYAQNPNLPADTDGSVESQLVTGLLILPDGTVVSVAPDEDTAYRPEKSLLLLTKQATPQELSPTWDILTVLENRTQLIAYYGIKTEVFLQDGTRFRYYPAYTLPANNNWILEAVGKQTGVWVNEDYRRVSLLRFGVRPGFTVSPAIAQANALAIQNALQSGEHLAVNGDICFDGPLVLSGFGDMGFSMKGAEGRDRLIAKSHDSGLSIVSSSLDPTGYAGRIQQVYLEGFDIIKEMASGATSAGTGLYIENFGFIGLKDIQILRFQTGLACINGSELYGINLRTPANGLGMRFRRDPTRSAGGGADMAAIELISCHTHNNETFGIELDSVRQVTMRGGTYAAGTTGAGALIHGHYAPVDYVTFSGINFENAPDNSQIIIGKTGSTNPITQVNIESCQLAIPNANKIIIHSQLAVLNFRDCSVDGNHAPTIVIKPTQVETPAINGLDELFPYWIQYNIVDERVSTQPTSLRLFKKPLINAFNTDFRKSYYGYLPNKPIEQDKTQFVTGDRSLRFIGDGTEKYMQINLWSDGGQVVKPRDGQRVAIEYIAKYIRGLASVGFSVLGRLLSNLDGSEEELDYITQVFTVQKFANGFARYATVYIVPEGKILQSLRVMNNASFISDLWIDNLKIYSDEIPVNAITYELAAPLGGIWYAGERVVVPTYSLERPSQYECIVSGEPGQWRGILPPLEPMFKAGEPSLSDCPTGFQRIITNSIYNTTELVYNRNGTLLCMPFSACKGLPPQPGAVITIAGHYDMETITATLKHYRIDGDNVLSEGGTPGKYHATAVYSDNSEIPYTGPGDFNVFTADLGGIFMATSEGAIGTLTVGADSVPNDITLPITFTLPDGTKALPFGVLIKNVIPELPPELATVAQVDTNLEIIGSQCRLTTLIKLLGTDTAQIAYEGLDNTGNVVTPKSAFANCATYTDPESLGFGFKHVLVDMGVRQRIYVRPLGNPDGEIQVQVQRPDLVPTNRATHYPAYQAYAPMGFVHGNVFQDNLGTNPANWIPGYDKFMADGTWNWTGGKIAQTDTSAGADQRAIIYTTNGSDSALNRKHTLVRIKPTSLSGDSRLGLGLGYDLTAKQGYCLVITSPSVIEFLHNGVGRGPTLAYATETGTDYWMRMIYEETAGSTAKLSGKIWKSGEIEPAGWMLVWSGQPRESGYPILTGGYIGSGAEFDEWFDATT